MRRRLPVAGGGVIGWVHHTDAAAATVAALEHGRPGQAYNLVDDHPAGWQELYTAMAEAELGWRPACPTYHDGVRAMVAAARKEEPWPSPGRSGAGTRPA